MKSAVWIGLFGILLYAFTTCLVLGHKVEYLRMPWVKKSQSDSYAIKKVFHKNQHENYVVISKTRNRNSNSVARKNTAELSASRANQPENIFGNLVEAKGMKSAAQWKPTKLRGKRHIADEPNPALHRSGNWFEDEIPLRKAIWVKGKVDKVWYI